VSQRVTPGRRWLFPDGHTVILAERGGALAPLPLDAPGVIDEDAEVAMAPGVRAAVVDSVPDGPGDVTVVERRTALGLLDHDLFHEMHRAFHLARWHRRTRFCGTCGNPTRFADGEMAKVCAACGATDYPRISPATIMAVVRDGALLMAHNRHRSDSMCSVLAGFVEPGESLEQCVAREVYEETRVVVRSVRYFASQPWAFPDSLMVGFTAEWASGEIHPDPDEIDHAGWYRADALPATIPPGVSISRRLIEWFVAEYGSTEDLRRVMERP